MAELGQLGLHMPGLLSLLGEHLYSDPRVAWRELVQNAHDAVTRRRLEHGETLPDAISLRCWRDNGRAWVSITDAGAGLTREDITDFLATIGRGQTRELRDAVERDGVRDLVGQFGVGLLATFLVADQIRVRTRHVTSEEGWEWVCEGQQTYRLDHFDVPSPGTEVLLRIRPDREELGHTDAVRAAVGRHCGFLPHPIEVGGLLVNSTVPPWVDPDRAMTHEAVAARVAEGALAILPLEGFEHPVHGHIELNGMLVVPEDSQLSLREYGHLQVYIRHMLITEREPDLLPPWARFVTGLVDCPQLQPTASRESVRRNAVLAAVRQSITAQLLSGLRRLQAEEPSTWAAVVGGHSDLLKRDCLRSIELFEAIADAITVPTTHGDLTLPDIAERTGGTLYACTDTQQERAMSLLLGAANLPVIDARWYADAPFLTMYAEHRGLPLIREIPTVLAGVVERAPAEHLSKVLRDLQQQDLRVRPARFQPAGVPLFLIVPRALRLQAFAEKEAQTDHPMAALLGTYASAPSVQSTLLVNVDHRLLAQAEALDDSARSAVLAVLRTQAALVAGEAMGHQDLLDATRQAVAGLQTLLEGRDGG